MKLPRSGTFSAPHCQLSTHILINLSPDSVSSLIFYCSRSTRLNYVLFFKNTFCFLNSQALLIHLVRDASLVHLLKLY